MYAIVKTGGKQYKVAEGDKLNIEKLDAQVGDTVALEAICIVDGDKVEADPAKAAKVEVIAEVLEQFKGEKAIVFKFKKRKNYKRKNGHRQLLTRVEIKSIGAAKKKAAKKEEPAKEAVEEKTVEAAVEADEAVEGDVQFCSKCGAKNAADAEFCNKCGAKLG
ncbi:MAG: 50S ribosomal protein L21 [Eggerthellaceae bacterium]|nr:50S ribosomal protein L21 [Eggerthellaceae bacterium]